MQCFHPISGADEPLVLLVLVLPFLWGPGLWVSGAERQR